MSSPNTADNSRPTATSNDAAGKFGRSLIGASIGSGAGAVVGWLIDSALTSDPYAGARIGAFVGALCGGVVGIGAGWRGIGMVLLLVLCSTGGSVLALALWNPALNSFMILIPGFIGGTLGAFIGLAIGVVLIRRHRAGAPADQPDEVHS